MEDYYEQIDALLQQSREMPDGPAQAAIIKRCVQLADMTEDQICQFHVRAIYIQSAFHSGEADEMLVALGWCMGTYDKDPEMFDSVFQEPDMIIGVMSHAFGYVTDFPTISREKIETMLDNFEERHRKAGIGLRCVYVERTRNAFWMGDLETASENFKKFLASPPEDGWSGESQRIFKTDFHVHMGDDKKAVAEAQPVIESTSPANEATHWVMCFVLASLVRLNRLEDAKSCHQRGYQVCQHNPKYLGLVSRHINYLLAVGETSKALSMFESHASWLQETCSADKKHSFFAVAWRLFRDLAQQGTSEVCVKLPENIGPISGNGNYNCVELSAWFESQTNKISGQFDARNGNDSATKSIEKMLSLKAIETA